MTTVTAQPTRGQPPGLVTGGVVTAQAIPGASGGLEVLNLLTGGPGFERVLTESDLTTNAPAAPDNAVQFNNAGAFGGSANFTWDDQQLFIKNTAAGVPVLQINMQSTNMQGLRFFSDQPITTAEYTPIIFGDSFGGDVFNVVYNQIANALRFENQTGAPFAEFNQDTIALGGSYRDPNNAPFTIGESGYGQVGIGDVVIGTTLFMEGLPFNIGITPVTAGRFWVKSDTPPTPQFTTSAGGDNQLAFVADVVPNTRLLTAGAGLTGGGDLSADRTFDVVANVDGSIVVNADDIQVGVLATDAQHGTRGGGTLHAAFDATQAGFTPQSPGGTNTFLRADGTWATPPAFGEYSGTFDASVGTFPVTTNQGNWFNTLVAGTVDGEPFAVGDLLVATVDNPSTTTFAGNWTRIPNVSTADVQGPASATDDAIARYDGTTGKLIQNSVVTIDDAGNIAGAGTFNGITPVSDARLLTAGAGLTGGGDLSADRTFDVVANADGSIVVNADDIQVGVLATDAQHGTRGGGTLHAEATTSVAGFLSAADKTKLDGLSGTFGTEQENGESLGQQSTTSSTYVTAYTYTTASLPAGDYFLTWSYDAGSDTDKESSHRVVLDGATVLSEAEWRFKEGTAKTGEAWMSQGGSGVFTLSAATHTIAFQFNTQATAYIRNMRVNLWRVS
jgi:hypothetical protein